MYSCQTEVKIEKKIAPFIDVNQKIVIEIESASSGRAVIHIPIKNGVSPDMLEAVGSVGMFVDFSNATQGNFSDNVAIERKPALPHVENEYDEVRDKVGMKLGDPVQTLFVGGASKPTNVTEKIARTVPVEKTVRPQEKVARPPIPEYPIEPVEETRQLSQVEIMQKQMDMMMKQMQIMGEMIAGKSQATEVVVPAERPVPKKKIDTIMNSEEFYQILDSFKVEIPNFDSNRRLTKQEAIELDKYRLPKSAYVISKCGQLFINDVGISVRQSTAANLAGIAIYKLKQSADLRMCFSTGKLQFVTAEMAATMAEKASINSAIEGVESGLKAFVGADGSGIAKADKYDADVTGTVDDSPTDSREIMARTRRGSQVNIQDVDENIPDEQSSLIDLAGSGEFDEPVSDAMIASRQARAGYVSAKHKPVSRMDD